MITTENARLLRNYHLNHLRKWVERHPDARKPKPTFDYWEAMTNPDSPVYFKTDNRNDGALRIFIKTLNTFMDESPGEWVQAGDIHIMTIPVADKFTWIMHTTTDVYALSKPEDKNYIKSFRNLTTGKDVTLNEYVMLYEQIVEPLKTNENQEEKE